MAGTQTTTKKRAATSQNGPSSKRTHLSKSTKVTSTDKKRSRPITHPVKADSESEEASDEGDIDEETLAGKPDEDGMLVDVDADDDAAPLNQAPKDPNATRESHKVQKELHQQRKAAKPNSDLLAEAKRQWSLAHRKNIPTAERRKDIHNLMNIIRGKVKEIVFKHDASRIVQTVVKYGQQKERDEIAVELKGKYKELSQNKYSKFLVTKLIRLCPTHRASILLEFQSHVLRLLLHREATSVLADAFELYANAYERSILLRDFYGKETLLFASGGDVDKDKARRGLVAILEETDEAQRKRILSATKENLNQVFNNEDKGAVTHAVVHRALWEYLTAVSNIEDESEQERLRREMFETCQDVLAEMVHTKDGSRVVREFLAQGSAKDRKQILKILKPHVERMCSDDEAQLVLFTALDVIDDTKLVSKSLISSVTSSCSTLCMSPQGRRALLYLVVPRTRRHFTPAQIALIAETDTARSKTSKKAPEVREEEIRKAASVDLLQWISSLDKQEKGKEVIRDPGGSLVVTEIMLFADGDKNSAMKSLLQALQIPYPSPDASLPHPIDLPHTSRLYKTLLQGGHFNRNSKSIDPAPGWDAYAFASLFADEIGEELMVDICTKGEANGCFVVAELCETLVGRGGEGEESRVNAVKQAREKVREWLGEDVKKRVEGGEAKGKNVLLEKAAML